MEAAKMLDAPLAKKHKEIMADYFKDDNIKGNIEMWRAKIQAVKDEIKTQAFTQENKDGISDFNAEKPENKTD